MNKTLPALPGKAAALPGAFEIGHTAHDGAQHRVPLAEAAVVRYADTQPTAASAPARGSGTCLWWSATGAAAEPAGRLGHRSPGAGGDRQAGCR